MTDITTFAHTPSQTYVVGIDVGGTKVYAGLADTNGTIVAELTEPTHNQGGASMVTQLVQIVERLADMHGIHPTQVAATGLGGAGVPNATTGFDLAPNLAATENGLSENLKVALGHYVTLENDVNVAAIGELHEGVGRESSNFVFIAVGTGIGMGIVANGTLVRGAYGAAGEIGYLPIGADPFDTDNHRRGPLEEKLAGRTLSERYQRSTGHAVTTPEVFDRAASGDGDALAAVNDEAKYLALALVAVNAVLNPEIIVLGGGIGARAELIGPLRSSLAQLGSPTLDIRFSQLGHRAPVIGAARLALDQLNSLHRSNLTKGSHQ